MIFRLARGLLTGLGFFLVLAAVPGLADETAAPKIGHSPYLAGQFLVASPKIGDPRFARTVIYMVSHDKKGALGLVVNKSYGSGSMEKFLKGFNIDASGIEGKIRLHYGGPVEVAAGFVLHTADYQGPGTRVVNSKMALTSEMSILKAIADGHGPRHSLFALGYSGWGPGQLESEIARGDWFSAPADEKIIFDEDLETIWDRVLGKAGQKL